MAAKVKSMSVWAIVYTILAFLAIFIALVLPSRPDQLIPLHFLRLPLELAGFFLLFALIGRILGSLMQIIVGLMLAMLVITRLADLGTQTAFGRSFNPLLDYFLLYPAYELLTGAIGPTLAIIAAVTAGLLAAGFLILYYFFTVAAGRFIRRHKLVFALSGLAIALAWLPLSYSEFSMAKKVRTATMDATWRSISLVTNTIESAKDIEAFEAEARVDDWRDVPAGKLLTALKGKDVLIVFIESYGRTSLDNPLYAPSVSDVLAKGTTRLRAKGIESRSAYLTSSTVGGLSWLAHGTFMSGLWVDNQRRYESLVISDRFTLNKAFRKAGWRTVAVMPAIARAWPEGGFYGYDEIYTASKLDYKGLPFNWVTMPDQYVMSAFRKKEIDVAGRKPVMAEFALISSHAPWTPVPKLVDWSLVGDGSIFNEQATSGDSPSVVWAKPERVRDQFRQTIIYALENMVSYAETFGAKNTVILAFGDHQPATIITGETGNRDVPVHLITADADVLAAIDGWKWQPSMLPGKDAPVVRMSDMRDLMLKTFSAP